MSKAYNRYKKAGRRARELTRLAILWDKGHRAGTTINRIKSLLVGLENRAPGAGTTQGMPVLLERIQPMLQDLQAKWHAGEPSGLEPYLTMAEAVG